MQNQKSFVIGLSYSFLGRQLEQLDAGYSTYSGFLHMYI